jgi:hypothetical protein
VSRGHISALHHIGKSASVGFEAVTVTDPGVVSLGEELTMYDSHEGQLRAYITIEFLHSSLSLYFAVSIPHLRFTAC